LLCSLVILATIHSCDHFMSKFVKDPVCSHRPRGVDRRPGEWNGLCSPRTAAFLCNRVSTSA